MLAKERDMIKKPQFYFQWQHDKGWLAPRPIHRQRVAYLLKAARSRRRSSIDIYSDGYLIVDARLRLFKRE